VAKRSNNKAPKAPPAPGVTRRRDWQPLFLEHLSKMGIVRLAAEAAGVGRQTVYDHRESDKAFAAKWAQAIDDAADTMEAEAYRRAVDGLVQKKFTKGGEPIIDPETGQQYFERVYSDNLLLAMLRAKKPGEYRDNITLTNAASPVVDEELVLVHTAPPPAPKGA
jgi:hypothetical protein